MARESTLSLGGSIGGLGLGFATKILLARTLTPADLGVLVIAQTIVSVGVTVGQMNLPDAVARFVAVHADEPTLQKARGVVDRAIWTGGTTAGIAAFIIVLVTYVAGQGTSECQPLRDTIIILALSIPFVALAEILGAGFRGINRLWVKVLWIDVAKAVWIALALASLTLLHITSLRAVSVVYVSGALLSLLVTSAYYLLRQEWRVSPTVFARADLLRYGLPLLIGGLVSLPMSFIPLLLGKTTSAGDVAQYAVAMSLTSFVYMPTGALDTAALPMWARRTSASPKELVEDYVFVSRWCFISAALIAAPLLLSTERVLAWSFGPQYLAAAWVVQAVCVLILLNASTGPNESLLRAFGRTRQIMVSRMLQGISVVCIGPFLIGRWGLAGAVGTYAIAQIIGNAVYQFYLLRLQRIHLLQPTYVKTVSAVLLAFAASWYVATYLSGSPIHIFTISGGFAATLAVLLTTSGAISHRDWDALRSAYTRLRLAW
ncbi:MAG: oligosaccharide flippase family protein [Vicinamibacterales bacterium]